MCNNVKTKTPKYSKPIVKGPIKPTGTLGQQKQNNKLNTLQNRENLPQVIVNKSNGTKIHKDSGVTKMLNAQNKNKIDIVNIILIVLIIMISIFLMISIYNLIINIHHLLKLSN